MGMQHFFANLKPVEWISILLSISVTLLFCWWIFFGFKGRSTSILAGTIYLTRQCWSGKLHATQIESWKETNTFYENKQFVDLFFYLDSSSTHHCAKALVSPLQLHVLRRGLPIVVKKGKWILIAVMDIGEHENAG
jgi:hypothetical protein